MSIIKNFNSFNENASDGSITLTLDDVVATKHNLGGRGKDKASIMKNWSWKEDQLLFAKPGYSGSKPQEWDGKQVAIYDLLTKDGKYFHELGYAILVDGKVEYIIGIYEPHGCSLNAKRGLVTAHGHEQIIKVWLDDGEFEETYTR